MIAEAKSDYESRLALNYAHTITRFLNISQTLKVVNIFQPRYPTMMIMHLRTQIKLNYSTSTFTQYLQHLVVYI